MTGTTIVTFPFGCRVRRKQLATEPGDREAGKVMGGTLDGSKTFVMFSTGGKRRMELLASDTIERVGKEK